MSIHAQPLLSEEDIRTRVVTTWLADHGFTAESISVEFSFELRLGRNIYRVGDNSAHSSTFRPRADILVRSADGKNLLIVEVKAPNEKLDDNVKEQGISYARLLRDGGIAPFVVTTNGHESHIYDSITGESVHGVRVPTNHPHVQNGFRVNIDDIALRSEALETFVSLSSDNLLAFCQAQVAQRMRLLRSDDPLSGKKYIPALYIEREDANNQLSQLLDAEHRPVVVLVGAPQVGKTNFICHTVEKRLRLGHPCLFYPAISMQGGLLEEISEDFSWILHSGNTPHQLVQRLTRILQQTDRRLSIFIDGWNEANQELAQNIDRGSERLSRDEIQIIVSLTNVASRRLLSSIGNPTYLSESALISDTAITMLEINSSKLEKNIENANQDTATTASVKPSIVFVNSYNEHEVDKAYQVYSKVFDVQVSKSHLKVNNPFVLRIAMEFAQNSYLPDILDEPDLLEKSIVKKSQRVSNLEHDCIAILLSELADEMFAHDSPIDQVSAKRRWKMPTIQEVPQGLFESALLTKVYSDNKIPSLAFYYDRERDFIIAAWARDWFQKLSFSSELLVSEFNSASRSRAGSEAVKWFLNQSQNLTLFSSISKVIGSFSEELKRYILSAARASIDRNTPNQPDWILDLLRQGVNQSSLLLKAEASELISVTLKSIHSAHFKHFISEVSTDKDLIRNLLDFDSTEWICRGKNGFLIYSDEIQFIVDALKHLHLYVHPHGDEQSDITVTLSEFIFNDDLSCDVQDNAARVLGYVDPYIFLKLISKRIVENSLQSYEESKVLDGAEAALDELEEIYYGSTCPGYIETLSGEFPETVICEYERIFKVCIPLINCYPNHAVSKGLLKLLNTLRKLVERIDPAEDLPDLERVKNLCLLVKDLGDSDIYQLTLPLDIATGS